MTVTRRHFMRATAAGAAFAGLPRFGWAQGKPITVSHSVSTFVYGPHLVAREKRMFEEGDGTIAQKDYENAMKVFVPIAIDKPLPYAKAVDLSFLKKAQAKYKS